MNRAQYSAERVRFRTDQPPIVPSTPRADTRKDEFRHCRDDPERPRRHLREARGSVRSDGDAFVIEGPDGAPREVLDPHVQARKLYQPLRIKEDIGEFSYPRPLYEFPDSPGGIRRPPVGFGEDNDYVYRELLGIDDAEYDPLVAEGHIATAFDASVP